MSTDNSHTDSTSIASSPAVIDEECEEVVHEVERLRLSRLLKITTELLPPDADILDALQPGDEVVDLPDSINLNDEILGNKLQALMQVVLNSLVPQLMATPLVYLGSSSWRLQSHSKFRAKLRRQLEHMIDKLKTKKEMDYMKVLDNFHQILHEIFQVRLPAMIDYYMNDNTYQRIPASKVSIDLCNKVNAAKNLESKERLIELARILTQWYTYCPVGRPHVYLSDDTWTLVSERDLRKYYRQQIASQVSP